MIDHERLLALAHRHNAVIRLEFGIGRFVQQGDRLATIDGPPESLIPADIVRKAMPIGAKRTLEADIEFGLINWCKSRLRPLSRA